MWKKLGTIALCLSHAPLVQDETDLTSLMARALDGESQDVDPGIFETIAAARDRLALNALIVCCERAPEDRRSAAFFALRHFALNAEFEAAAIEFLAQEAEGSSARAAVKALVHFGAAAQADLERLVAESEDALVRQRAIGGFVGTLAVRGMPGLELFLEHYRPPLSGSATRGAGVLASFRDEACREEMLDAFAEAKTPPEVKAMIATALARQRGDPAAEALHKALRSKHPAVTVAAIDGLQARGADIRVQQLESLARKESGAVRFAAFRALMRARYGSPDFERDYRRALGGRDFALRMAVAAGLAEATDPESAPELAQLIDDDHSAVRKQAIESARVRRIEQAIPHLIARMEADGETLRRLAHDALIELTGLDHGPTSARWSAWWAGEAEGFVVPDHEAALALVRERRTLRAEAATQSQGPSFYGVRFASERVVFVLDISGSMGEQGRLERMKRETLAAFEQIPDDSTFNLVFFADRAMPWGRKLVRMTDRNRYKAQVSVSALVAGGGTNLHGALEVAFNDPDVETIVLLSDGAPSVGVKHDESILRDVRRWNELRGVVVHSVALGTARGDGLLDSVSAITGGQAVEAF